jgi:hypothetical protein
VLKVPKQMSTADCENDNAYYYQFLHQGLIDLLQKIKIQYSYFLQSSWNVQDH